MQQGEFVDVEKVEGVVRGVGGIDLGVVYGDGTRNCLVCLVTVEPGLEIGEKAILESIRSNCVENKLKGFEVPKAVRIVGEFSVDNGCITPTFKVIRKGKVPHLFLRRTFLRGREGSYHHLLLRG